MYISDGPEDLVSSWKKRDEERKKEIERLMKLDEERFEHFKLIFFSTIFILASNMQRAITQIQ